MPPKLATARSSRPSPLKSPATTTSGYVPSTAQAADGWNVPSPLPSSTETGVGAVVRRGQVEPAVAVEIARHQRIGSMVPPATTSWGLERAVAVAQRAPRSVGAGTSYE